VKVSHSRPTPQDQLEFLAKIQRLLGEGQFTATYKFALLHALADLCVDKGDDSGAPLELTVGEIADRFFGLYDRQSLPYPSRRGSKLLKQNTGRQARVVTVLSERARPYGAKTSRGRPSRKILGEINRTIRNQPLWKLQTLTGGDRLEFLYKNEGRPGTQKICLHPGVAYCFRSFYGLIVSLVRDRWEQWIRRTNPGAVEERKNLQEFLFGSERGGLVAYRPVLLEIQDGKCFYTDRPLREGGHVDHFIPWSRYPVDLGHNFVLANRGVNAQKADALAGEQHLKRWLRRCEDQGEMLTAWLDGKGLPHDLRSSIQVVEWSYSQLVRGKGQVWVEGKTFADLSPGWRSLIDNTRRRLFPGPQAS
jgi:hypothetical protein